MTSLDKISIAIAGSTLHSLKIAKALYNNPKFVIRWILTPAPKKIGRKQELHSNPLHHWAVSSQIPHQLVEDKIIKLDSNFFLPDYLLVVDFGYIIPDWLLSFPKITTLNLHPSALPLWRGSSPGQFVLLSGENSSAISLIELTSQLDAGPIIQQVRFAVDPVWTSADYYQHSFDIASEKIADWIEKYCVEKEHSFSQPKISPTPITKKITKNDAFVPWEIINSCMQTQIDNNLNQETLLSSFPEKSILIDFFHQAKKKSWPILIERATRAFQPWPILWTFVLTEKGTKRMQILDCEAEKKSNGDVFLTLKKIKVEGLDSANWNEVKKQIK